MKCVSLIHVGMVDNASRMVKTLTASALLGTEDVSAMLVNTTPYITVFQSKILEHHYTVNHMLTECGVCFRPR